MGTSPRYVGWRLFGKRATVAVILGHSYLNSLRYVQREGSIRIGKAAEVASRVGTIYLEADVNISGVTSAFQNGDIVIG